MSANRYSVRRMRVSDPTSSSTATRVGERLRALRLEAGLTQAQLAVRLGTTQSAIARLEGGLRRTSLQSIDKVVAALGCETALLIRRKQDA